MGFMQINTKMSLGGTGKHIRKKSMSDLGIQEVSQNVLGRSGKHTRKKSMSDQAIRKDRD